VRSKPQRTAELRIGEPQTFDKDAFCPVQLVGIGDEKVRPIFGVDRVQALQLALRYLEPLLLRFGEQLRWGSESALKSLHADPWALFEGAGLSEFLSKFAALCVEHAAKGRPPARPTRTARKAPRRR
jgi:hypothetical protein